MSNAKNAIITGGSRGIGRAMALKLGEMGYNVVINYTSESSKEKAEAIAAEIEKNGVSAWVVRADMSKVEECKRLVDESVALFGDTIDALVCNAGIYVPGLLHETNWEDTQRQIDINFTAQLAMCQFALPYMVGKNTNIVLVSSMGGMVPIAMSSVYGATKTGSIGLSRCLAADYADKGVRVNNIAPGTTDTDIIVSRDPEFIKSVEDGIPMHRMGQPEEMAQALEYILKAAYLTGQIISPNGGAAIM